MHRAFPCAFYLLDWNLNRFHRSVNITRHYLTSTIIDILLAGGSNWPVPSYVPDRRQSGLKDRIFRWKEEVMT